MTDCDFLFKMAAIDTKSHVTIVSVGSMEAKGPAKPSQEAAFVTVLSIGQPVEEEVSVYRLPGEKLGFGLKFEGGMQSAECVRRLFIQSCAPESPAGRAKAAWGSLEPGDEIVSIDRTPVTSLTRLQCVRCLKDSNVAVKLLIRHNPEGRGMETEPQKIERPPLPPPVPPRKIHRKGPKENGTTKQEPIDNPLKPYENSHADQSRKAPIGKQSPGRPRRMAPMHSAPPAEAQVYTDLFCHEKENGIHVAESESDDTGSSISTVIDRMSAYSSFPGSVENSIPSTPTLGPKHMQVLSSKSMEEKFLSELPARMLEEFSAKDLKMVKVSAPEVFHVNGDHPIVPPPVPERTTVAQNAKPLIEEQMIFNNSDANNNTSTIKITTKMPSIDVVDAPKSAPPPEIPKPLPRNLNKRNLDSHSTAEYGRQYEDNLSPTKLQNIESWLQEAIDCSMLNLTEPADGQEYEPMKPEALPRLIDFVPKMQYSDGVVDKPVPAERKEIDYGLKLAIVGDKDQDDEMSSDYGGDNSQLETIGEDDEDSPNCTNLPIIKITQQSTNVETIMYPTDPPPKPPPPEPTPEAKKHIRGPEDCGATVVVTRGPRSPPDGRENPAQHQESVPVFAGVQTKMPQDTFAKKSQSYMAENVYAEPMHRSLSYDAPYKNNKVSTLTKTYGRGKDVKSEGSVRDKIAMFSSHRRSSENLSDRKVSLPAKPLDTRPQHRLSYNDSVSKSYESLLDPYKGKPDKVSQSNHEWSVNGLSKGRVDPPPYDNGYDMKEKPKDTKAATLEIRSIAKTDLHRSTIDLLIEQRRQSMTKLRGLVIPDSLCISNLPEIKSRDTMKVLSTPPVGEKTSVFDRYPTKKPVTPTTPLPNLWDSQHILNNVPKYSPAFKRKPLQVYGPKSSNTMSKYESVSGVSSAPSKPPRTALDPIDRKVNTLPTNFRRASAPTQISTKPIRPETFSSIDTANLKIMKSFSEADSDNDSAVSSTQSSYLSTVSSPTPSLNTVDNSESDCSSQSTLSRDATQNGNDAKENGLSKNMLQMGEPKRAVCRSLSSDTSTSGSSNSSTLTSGSQASCSSAGSSNTDSHRILKPRSIEAINRKNILASAKCRSGKDNKFGSPLIERKFSDDSTVESTDELEPKRYRNGDIIQYHSVQARDVADALNDPQLKVAFTTLVEDRCPEDAHSDFEYDKPKTEAKIESRRISNGVQAPNNGKVNGSRPKECESSEEDLEEECFEVRLSRAGGGGVGVTLAGGVDCEAKEVTIHKVLQGSPAERDGRLCKGDRVVSINGHSMRGVTHAQSVAILKDPQPEVSIVVRGKQPATDISNNYSSIANGSAAVISVELEKADAPGGAGLGISLEGGGNKPLLINKLFTGGAAFRSGKIVSGSELLVAGGTKLVGLTRTEAWGLLRALPPGPVTLVLRPP